MIKHEALSLGSLQGLACLTIVIAGVHLAAAVLVPILLALCLAVVLEKMIGLLSRLGVPRPAAIVLVSGGVLLALLMALLAVAAALPELGKMNGNIQLLLTDRLRTAEPLLTRAGLSLSVESAISFIDPGHVFGMATRALSRISGILFGIVMVFLMVAFMLLEVPTLKAKCRRLFPAASPQWSALQQGLGSVTRYLALKTLISLLIGLAVWGVLLMLNVKFAFIWGMLALALNFIPVVGSIAAAVPPLLQAFLLNGVAAGSWLLMALLLINLVFSFMLEPVLMGRRLDLSTCTVILSLLVWQSLLGMTGVLLAVPLTLAVKLTLAQIPSGKKLALLMGGKL